MARTSTKSTTPTAESTNPTQSAPASTASQSSQGSKANPLQAVMRIAVGKGGEVTEAETELLKQFLSGQLRLSDSHYSQIARFAQKQNLINYTRLAIRCAGQLAVEEGGSLPQHREAIEQATGVKCAQQDTIDGSYDNSYLGVTIEAVDNARSWLWNAYGDNGSVNPGLITRANARLSQMMADRA